MSKKVKDIIAGIFCLTFAVAWFTVLSDWQLMLFRVIPINNVVAGIFFALAGVISLFDAFADKKKDEEK